MILASIPHDQTQDLFRPRDHDGLPGRAVDRPGDQPDDGGGRGRRRQGHLVKHHLVTLVTLSSITLNTLVIFSSVRKYNFTDFPQITIADFKRLMAKWTS